MKYTCCLLLTFAFLALACKKEEQITTMIVTTETPYVSGNSTSFRGSIFAHPNKINVTEHGFRIIESGPFATAPYLDTTINLGAKTEIGNFQSVLSNLETGVDYKFYAYVVDNNKRRYSSRADSIFTPINILTVTTENPFLTKTSTTLKGLIYSNATPVGFIDHGFRITETGLFATAPYLDTIISLGARNYTGSFQYELFNLEPGVDYIYSGYVINNDSAEYQGQDNFFRTLGTPQ